MAPPNLARGSGAGLFSIGVNFSEDYVTLFEPPFFDLRIEISLRSMFVLSDSKSRQVVFFFEKVEFVSLKSKFSSWLCVSRLREGTLIFTSIMTSTP